MHQLTLCSTTKWSYILSVFHRHQSFYSILYITSTEQMTAYYHFYKPLRRTTSKVITNKYLLVFLKTRTHTYPQNSFEEVRLLFLIINEQGLLILFWTSLWLMKTYYLKLYEYRTIELLRMFFVLILLIWYDSTPKTQVLLRVLVRPFQVPVF